MEKVNLFDISFDFFRLIMIFMRVQIGNHTGNGSSRQSATGGDNGGGSSSRGGRETSDEEEDEEEPAPCPETNRRTNEGKNKRQRTGIPDQSKEYFGVAMEKIVSSAVSSAINSTGVDRNRERDYVQMEQQRRERAESQLREFELKQKLSDQRSAIICTSDAQVMNDGALESLRREDSNGVINSIPVSRCQSVERIWPTPSSLAS
jgi:hypothetical protein